MEEVDRVESKAEAKIIENLNFNISVPFYKILSLGWSHVERKSDYLFLVPWYSQVEFMKKTFERESVCKLPVNLKVMVIRERRGERV